jgi:hypothetical protein
MGDALNYLEEGMPAEVVFYEGKAHLGRTAHQPSSARSPGPSRPSRATPRARCSSPPRSRPASRSACRSSCAGRQGRDRHPHRRIPPPRVRHPRTPRRLRKGAFFAGPHGFRALPHRRALPHAAGTAAAGGGHAPAHATGGGLAPVAEKKQVLDAGASRLGVPASMRSRCCVPSARSAGREGIAGRGPHRARLRAGLRAARRHGHDPALALRLPALALGPRGTSRGNLSLPCTPPWPITRRCWLPRTSSSSSSPLAGEMGAPRLGRSAPALASTSIRTATSALHGPRPVTRRLRRAMLFSRRTADILPGRRRQPACVVHHPR